jgi:hypothetical protein
VFRFKTGARGSAANPARVTRLDAQSVGSLTNWPAFKDILPVAASEPQGVVNASGTSEGAKKGWEHRTGFVATERARVSSEEAEINPRWHGEAHLMHKLAAEIHEGLGNKEIASVHSKEAERHQKLYRDHLVKKWNDAASVHSDDADERAQAIENMYPNKATDDIKLTSLKARVDAAAAAELAVKARQSVEERIVNEGRVTI